MTRARWVHLFLDNYTQIGEIVLRFNHDNYPEYVRLWKNPLKHHRRLKELMETAWDDAPDKPWIRQLPGWLNMCDLISEYEEAFG